MLVSRIRRSAPCSDTAGNDVRTARRFMCAEPPEVLEALIDPEFMSLWAPVDLEVDGVVLSVTPAAGAPIGEAAISTGTWAVTAH